MNLELIKANLLAQLEQIDKIEELKAELKNLKGSNFYGIFSTEENRELDIKVKEAEIRNAETILMGMMK